MFPDCIYNSKIVARGPQRRVEPRMRAEPRELLPKPAMPNQFTDERFGTVERMHEEKSDEETDEETNEGTDEETDEEKSVDDDQISDYGPAVTDSPAKSRCYNFDEPSFRHGSFLPPIQDSFIQAKRQEHGSIGDFDHDFAVCVDNEEFWPDAVGRGTGGGIKGQLVDFVSQDADM